MSSSKREVRPLGAARRAAGVACLAAALGLPAAGAVQPAPSARPAEKPWASAAADKTAKPAKPPTLKRTQPAAGFVQEPVPAWVLPVAPDASLAASLPKAPVHVLLLDSQTQLERQGASRFVHHARVIKESAGLEMGSQVQIEFDPSYQKLALHYVKVRRAGIEQNRLDARKVQLLRRETGLERQIYDGRMTATLVLDDIRVDDQIEYAYTLRGDNPVFAGKFVDNEWSVGALGPVGLLQLRLLAPQDRSIQHRVGSERVEVSTRAMGAWQETLFRRQAAPQFRYDASAPEDVLLGDQIQLSEFSSWAEVASWAQSLFKADAAASSPALRAQAESLRAAAETPEERVRLALDFVQTQVRYLGTEMGANSHLPAKPDVVLQQRFGDCKDKVALLIALVKEMGIEASPVLVSTMYRGSVESMLPSPLAFNHAIARVHTGGTAWLLDGTRSQQTGPLAERQSVGLGHGLEASTATTSLLALPGAASELRASSDDTLRFTLLAEDPTLETSTSFHGELAEGVRAALANPQARPEFEKQLLADYARIYPSLRSEGGMTVEEVAGHNALRVRMTFKLPRYLRFPEQKTLAGDYALLNLMQVLRVSDQGQRLQPFKLATPGIYRQSVSLKFPEEVFTEAASSRFDEVNRQFELHVTTENTTQSVRVQGELKQTADRVASGDWQAYRDNLGKLWPRLSGVVAISSVNGPQSDQAGKRLKQLAEDQRAGRLKLGTRVQAESQARLVWLEAQQASNRLSPAFRTQLLISRGVQLDQLSRHDEAAASFQQALVLEPDNAEAHAGAAVNALTRQQLGVAIEHATRALQLAPSDNGPRYTRAYAHYFAGEYQKARDELLELLKDSREQERGYASIWLHLSNRRLGVSQEPMAAAAMPVIGAPAAWPLPVLQVLTGSATPEQALAAAQADAGAAGGRLCELHFYLGEQQSLNGQPRLAAASFKKAMETGVSEFNEYGFAKWSLARMAP